MKINKAELVDRIKKMFKKAIVDGVEHIFIYYTGWSCFPTGNWMLVEHEDYRNDKIEDNRISFADLMDAARSADYSKSLDITCDCSFSGEWAHTAKSHFESHKEKFQVYVNPVCSRDSLAGVGSFRNDLRVDDTSYKYTFGSTSYHNGTFSEF